MAVKGLYREVRRQLRFLKRKWASRIVLRHLLTQERSATDGTVTKNYDDIVVRRAIVLPARETRDFVYDLSFVAANKNFTYGGHYDIGKRGFVIDWDDLPSGLVIEKNDYIIYMGRRWDIDEVLTSAEYRFTAPIGIMLDGVPKEEQHSVSSEDTMEQSGTDG